MGNVKVKKDIYLDLCIDDDKFGFSTSIDDALIQANAELVVLNETVDSIKELGFRPDDEGAVRMLWLQVWARYAVSSIYF